MHSFIAATATGVPPRVPSFETDGTASVRSSAFDSAALTKPTGVPMTTAGRIPRRTMPQTVRRADGAFPMTTTDPLILSSRAINPAELRVMPRSLARAWP